MRKKPRRNDERRKEVDTTLSLSEIDYKKPHILRRFMSSRRKVLPQKVTGLSAKKQRKLSSEIAKARIVGLLPFTDRHDLG